MEILLLETDNNKRGDLFTRLMADLFHALGYGACRFNVHRSGREIDVSADHRVEPRAVVAECKATSDPVGGSAVNKFIGVLDAERRLRPALDITGYVVSMSGFTETALQQEREIGNRVVLLSGAAVLEHLVAGRFLVDRAAAAAAAAAVEGTPPSLYPDFDLLASERGWTWVIYFGMSTLTPTHAVLVHADGTVLAEQDSEMLARQANGRLQNITILGRKNPGASVQHIKSAYRAYIGLTCGDITLDGMPADEQVGARRIQLEHLYVPQALQPLDSEETQQSTPVADWITETDPDPIPVGSVLRTARAISVLGGPGAGKSTLVKRLATAYADSQRLTAIADDLPDEFRVPIVIRCRELSPGSFQSFYDVITGIATQLEQPQLISELVTYLFSAARDGRALLLIDGLDEIPDPSLRQQFVNQLRVFVGTYPGVSLVVTSREVGFRAVAGAVDSICARYAVAPLSDGDIRMLTTAWFRETDASGSGSTANTVATEILGVDRVRRLARNPLLLTILLLVRRWAGEVPRRRTVLYGRAIDVLLATWNVEAHEPLDADEALPQLAYTAFCMMERGVQSLTTSALTEILSMAREEMPEVVAYTRMSISEFIQRVEERSSLLSLTGHTIVSGQLEPTYEFKHLTFQEYLAALGAARGWHPRRKRTPSAHTALKRYLTQESWREVVPLTCALAGTGAGGIVNGLIRSLPAYPYDEIRRGSAKAGVARSSLLQCLLDEVQLKPELVQRALEVIVEGSPHLSVESVSQLLRGRFAVDVPVVIERGYEDKTDYRPAYGSALALLRVATAPPDERRRQSLARCRKEIAIGDRNTCRDAALETMHYAFTLHASSDGFPPAELRSMADALIDRLETDPDPGVRFACLWAFCWIARGLDLSTTQATRYVNVLADIWAQVQDRHDIRWVTWAISAISTLPARSRQPVRSSLDLRLQQALEVDDPWLSSTHQAALLVAYVRRSPWNARQLTSLFVPDAENFALQIEMLETLGVNGAARAAEFKKMLPAGRWRNRNRRK